jgi:3-oxoacyl-[acyl-carrier protein] reductase
MLNGEIALITGATRGIGRAIALTLGRVGATVAGTATTEAGASRIADTLREEGCKGLGLELNVTDQVSIVKVLKHLSDELGDPTILVNNAGITRDNLLMRMKETDWDEVIDTDLSSVYRMSKACLRGMMKARKGRIINISSVIGATGNGGQTNYAAAKAGMIGFTRSLAREVGSRGITVNAVAPGFIDTAMTRALGEAQREQLLDSIPLGRFGDPQDVATIVAFLASESAGYITGETIHVNGGMYMA